MVDYIPMLFFLNGQFVLLESANHPKKYYNPEEWPEEDGKMTACFSCAVRGKERFAQLSYIVD